MSELGMWGSGFKFFARSTVNPFTFLSDGGGIPNFGLVWLQPSAPGQLPTLLGGAFGPLPHFPYGFGVEPDPI